MNLEKTESVLQFGRIQIVKNQIRKEYREMKKDERTTEGNSRGKKEWNNHGCNLKNYLFVFFWDRVSLLLRLKCSGTVMAHCSLNLLGSANAPASVTWVARTTDVHHHDWLIFKLFVNRGYPYVAQAVLNSWVQAILLPQPPKVLRLQVWATMPSQKTAISFFFSF